MPSKFFGVMKSLVIFLVFILVLPASLHQNSSALGFTLFYITNHDDYMNSQL